MSEPSQKTFSPSIGSLPVRKFLSAGADTELVDELAVEEPLLVKVTDSACRQMEWTMMRTPGHDKALVLGFLYGEGIIRSIKEVGSLVAVGTSKHGNPLSAEVLLNAELKGSAVERMFYLSSACGVCARHRLDDLEEQWSELEMASSPVDRSVICALPNLLGGPVFDATGGVHSCVLLDFTGKKLLSAEDVGRHNATDKVVGMMLEARLHGTDKILGFSGRIAFELVQKALAARVPIIAGIGAATTEAVALAQRYQMTLLGFVRKDRFTSYTWDRRIK